MRSELEQIQIIEQYIEGRLEGQALINFETQLQSDPELEASVSLQREVQLGLNRAALVNLIRANHAQFINSSGNTGFKPWYLNTLFLFGLGLIVSTAMALIFFKFNLTGERKDQTSKHSIKEKVEYTTDSDIKIAQHASEKPNYVYQLPSVDTTAQSPVKTEVYHSDTAPIQETEGKTHHPLLAITPYKSKRKLRLSDFEVPYDRQNFLAEDGITYTHQRSGSVVRIPGNILTQKNGTTASGEVTLIYREFRDAADMAFSRINMVFDEDNHDWFHSAGMCELYVLKGNDTLALKAPIEIDMMPSAEASDLAFYTYEHGQWDKQFDIPSQSANSFGLEAQISEAQKINVNKDVIELRATLSPNEIPLSLFISKKRRALKKIKKSLPDNEIETSRFFIGEIDTSATRLKDSLKKDRRRRISVEIGASSLFNRWRKWDGGIFINRSNGISKYWSYDPVNNQFTSSSDQQSKASENYSKLISGLSTTQFGVHNCDQIYRVGNPISIKPKFVDQFGVAIEDGSILSLIDQNYNGAFSFSSRAFKCNPNGKNELILFTRSGKIYVLDKFWSELNISKKGEHIIPMRDATDELNSTEGLRNYLRKRKSGSPVNIQTVGA